jgi:REP element-mobilizing transposase RayT
MPLQIEGGSMTGRFTHEDHRRRSVRLPGYDYGRAGAYFVTICTVQRECLLGDVVDGQMQLSDYGRIVEEEWMHTSSIREYATLDAFVVMPNHLHGVILLAERAEKTSPRLTYSGQFGRPVAGALPAILGAFKSVTSRRINEVRGVQGLSLWQRGYYEHVVRDEKELLRIRDYIASNPARWSQDENNPVNGR